MRVVSIKFEEDLLEDIDFLAYLLRQSRSAIIRVAARRFLQEHRELLAERKKLSGGLWRCPICGQQAATYSALIRHVSIEHPMDIRDPCPACGKIVLNIYTHLRQNIEDPKHAALCLAHLSKKSTLRKKARQILLQHLTP